MTCDDNCDFWILFIFPVNLENIVTLIPVSIQTNRASPMGNRSDSAIQYGCTPQTVLVYARMHFCALTLNVGENRSCGWFVMFFFFSAAWVFHLELKTLFVRARFLITSRSVLLLFFCNSFRARVLHEMSFNLIRGLKYHVFISFVFCVSLAVFVLDLHEYNFPRLPHRIVKFHL